MGSFGIASRLIDCQHRADMSDFDDFMVYDLEGLGDFYNARRKFP